MKVGVAGAGAVGCHYGAMLQRAGHDVAFLARGAHLAAMREHGLVHETGGQTFSMPVRASDDAGMLADAGCVLLTCKMTALATMLDALKDRLSPDALLVTLQNGVQAPDMVADAFPQHGVIAGSAFIGVRIEAPGQVVHSAAGHVRLGTWRASGYLPCFSALLQAMKQAGIEAYHDRDMHCTLWNKMLWNCGFNAITALTRRYARDIAADPASGEIVRAAMRETLAVAASEGISPDDADIEKNIRATLAAGPVRTSMWQDIERGRPTEIDYLNGYIAREAAEKGMTAPVNTMLAALIRVAEGRSVD
ncbi:MAG: 2-dehydropantoate 2-reductase [Mariprofundaceae bacterium]|nr:2-dehydropantoate 2-reductase [Mariprofundaceae bacterium]